MSELARALDLIEHQKQSYRVMYRTSLRQRECIECEDMDGLNRAFDEMHQAMEQILKQQARMPDLGWLSEEEGCQVRVAQSRLRPVVDDVEQLRQINVQSIRRLMEQTRGELRQFGRGRRAVKGYRSAAVGEARFFDGRR